MGYPITDLMSGRPRGAAPVIRTLGRAGERKELKPRYIILREDGLAPEGAAKLFRESHWMVSDLSLVRAAPTGPEGDVDRGRVPEGWTVWNGWMTPSDNIRKVSIYRGRSRKLKDEPGVVPAESIVARPVSGEEIEVLTRLNPGAAELSTEMQASLVRYRRGDLDTIAFLLDSPWFMTEAEAEEAGMLGLGTEHLHAGVREEHGRWVYYRGLGSHQVNEGSADTREEAEILARACLFRAWIEEVDRIRRKRGGSLEWGWPVFSPFWQEIGDPQKDY